MVWNKRQDKIRSPLEMAWIKTAHKSKRTVGICCDAPSTFPEFTEFLVKNRIDSVSVTPDVAINTRLVVAKAEKK